ncbi:MAG TPA: nitroreductase family protein [Melioribacteraceae bacterium]|nr:nitroreductase family protein [Melioribacteraceae bacterium]
MELKEVLEKRTSIRKFKDDEVPVEILRKIAKAGGMAPSINNSQPWRFIAITNKQLLNNMAHAVRNKLKELFGEKTDFETELVKRKVDWFSTFFADVPAVIAVVGEPYKAEADDILTDLATHEQLNELRNHPNLQTIGAAVENMLLTAIDLGYGACWLTGPLVAKKELQELLNIKAPNYLACLVAVGKSNDTVHPKQKKSITEIFEIIS